jgi:hypothetical protein
MKRAWCLLTLASAAVVVTAVAALSDHVVPLYDGIGFPDEPYRYVSPPQGAPKTTAATGAQHTFTARNGTNPDYSSFASAEQGPQVSVYIQNGVLNSERYVANFTVRADPRKPDVRTQKGSVAGNVYHLSADTDTGKPVSYDTELQPRGYIDLRLPQGYSFGGTIFYRQSPQAKWQALTTRRVGNDIYEAPLVGLGDYGLVHTAYKAPRSGPPIAVWVLGSFLMLVAAGLAVLRWHEVQGERKDGRK